jgi:hypothetical protein
VGRLRPRLDEILKSGKPPHIARPVDLPVILIATPEIVSLPEHMGNLANIIRTGDGGGLADISSAVVTELYRQGVNVHVTLPHYRNLFATLGKISDEEYRALIRAFRNSTASTSSTMASSRAPPASTTNAAASMTSTSARPMPSWKALFTASSPASKARTRASSFTATTG